MPDTDKPTDLSRNIRVRLPWPCGPALLAHYVALAERRGKQTTREDAFEAWLAWLDGNSDLTADSWPGNDHAKVAAAIREAARYA